jgi:hypothetical protein
LRVARAGQGAGEVACLVAQPPGLVSHERLEQPQQRPPALHRPPEVVDGFRVRLVRVGDGRASFGEDVAGHGTQRLADRDVHL